MNTFDKFFKESQAEMIAAGVKVSLPNTPHVDLTDNFQCNGYFDADTKFPFKMKFACGVGKAPELWQPVYLHEYCHFTQCRDKAPEWLNENINTAKFFDEWLAKEAVIDPAEINKFINASIAVEADCERRVIKLMEEFDLPFDREVYAQKSNAYVHFYNYVRLKEKWYELGKEPYNLEPVVSQFNKDIDDEFPVSWEYMDLFDKHCF